jgi:hypothetical protein
MSYVDIVDKFFAEMDADANGFIDAAEWLHHLKAKSPNAHRDKASRKLRWVHNSVTGFRHLGTGFRGTGFWGTTYIFGN